MIRVRHYGGAEWGIESPSYSPTVHLECKATPGLRWTPERHAWCGYVDGIDAAARRILAKKIRIDVSALPEPGQIPTNILAPIAVTDLRPYQVDGAKFLIGHSASGAFLADEVGVGKTVQALRAARALRGRLLIVCPNFLKNVWEVGLDGDKKLDPPTPAGWPGQKRLILKGTTTAAPDAASKSSKAARESLALADRLRASDCDTQIVIVNYDILYAWVDVLLAWAPQTVVFDEAHYLMGDKARRTRAAERLTKSIPSRMMLSATPMTSRPRDLWAPVNVLSEGRFGAPFAYFKKHAAAFQERISAERVVWNTKGSSDLPELQRRLSFFMLRRTQEDVALQLPPRTRQIIEVDVERRFQLSMAVALQNDDSLRRALDMAADGKLQDVAQIVLGHVQEGGKKVVVGTWRKAVAEELANALRGAGVDAHVITGDVSAKKRAEILKAQPEVICATLDSMGVGLDLSFASIGVCAELHYVPSKLVQWEGRIHRFRQKLPTLFQYIIARGTADELIKDMVIRKLHTFSKGVGKSSDKLGDDLSGIEKSPTQVLKGLYERMKAKQKADPNAEIAVD